MKSLQELIKSVGRELGIRKAVYPKWIGTRMTADEVRHEIQCMQDVYNLLKERANEKPQDGNGEMAFMAEAKPSVTFHFSNTRERDEFLRTVKSINPNLIAT